MNKEAAGKVVQLDVIEEFESRPSVAAYLARAFFPSTGLREGGAFPRIVERWKRLRIDTHHLRAFISMTGLPMSAGISLLHSPAAALLYPHVFGFPLHMALLTHRAFPLPIWGTLQIRNHMLLHRPFSERETLNLETRVAGQRILAKGIEVDLHSTLSVLDELVWEGLTTFYYRGQYGPAQTASPLAKPLPGEWPETSRWCMPGGVGWGFAGLTGDYNGIHWQNWYARLLGFKASLNHPQLVIGQCLARLSMPASSCQRLDVWLKGPVYYNTDVRLRTVSRLGNHWFDLSMDEHELPSIVGRWSTAAPESRLIDEMDLPLPIDEPA
jgi:hypothetical protein